MNECKHNKVYANVAYTSFPPQKMWICRKCGAEGIDSEFSPPSTFANEYDALKKKFQSKT